MLSFRSKLNLAGIAFVLLLMVLGCQPEGGELLPISGENIEIATSRFENDTAIISDNKLKIKLYGSWDGRANVRMIFENNDSSSVKVKLNEFIVSDSKGGNIKIDSFAEEKDKVVKKLEEKELVVAPSEKRKMLVGFPLNMMDSMNEDLPRVISVIVVVENSSKPAELKKYKFDFKGIEKRTSDGNSDPEF